MDKFKYTLVYEDGTRSITSPGCSMAYISDGIKDAFNWDKRLAQIIIEPEQIMKPELKQGWGWPTNSKVAHFFRKGKAGSLCGKIIFYGDKEDVMHDSKINCEECMQMREKLIARGELK